MGSAKEAADKVQLAADDARKTIQAAGQVMKEATSGDGLLDDVANERRSGK